MSKIVLKIRAALKAKANKKNRESAKAFFKEDEKLKFYGVKAAQIKKIASQSFRELKNLTKIEIFGLCENLLQSGYSEEAYIAYEFACRLKKQYEPADFMIFEKWLNKYVSNWAECDTFCPRVIGTFIDQYPLYLSRLIKFTKSKNRWVRRAAAVSLIMLARRGRYFKNALAIADRLLLDKDDLVQKGYGWLLKEASRQHQREVFDYVCKHKKIMPRTALRYAIEKMPDALKKKAMERS